MSLWRVSLPGILCSMVPFPGCPGCLERLPDCIGGALAASSRELDVRGLGQMLRKRDFFETACFLTQRFSDLQPLLLVSALFFCAQACLFEDIHSCGPHFCSVSNACSMLTHTRQSVWVPARPLGSIVHFVTWRDEPTIFETVQTTMLFAPRERRAKAYQWHYSHLDSRYY